VKLSLGPVLYYWTREALLDFYANLPHSRLATIYLGEVVCGRRLAMRPADWLGLARDLARTGVEVVLSTQVLIESELDLRAVRNVAENGEFLVEANDMGAVRLLAGRVRFVAGPHLNVYNPQTLAWLAELGACRWVMPVELGRDALALLQRGRPVSRPRSSPTGACRSHSPRDASPRGTTIFPRTTASTAASIIRTACRLRPAKDSRFSRSTGCRHSRRRSMTCRAPCRRCASWASTLCA
jgi:hypothetical protein